MFSTSAKSIDDLAVGMELTGTVRNVFDDLVGGRLAEYEVVSVRDNVTVRVTGIDKTREKISLSMVKGK